MGRAVSLTSGIARIARDAGPRAAVAAAVQVASRFVVSRSGLGLTTLEARSSAERAAIVERLRFEIEQVEEHGQRLDARQADLERREAELADHIQRLSTAAVHVEQSILANRQALDEHGRTFHGVAERIADSLRVLTRLADRGDADGGEADAHAATPESLLISVVIPVHNRADLIPACLDSVLGQDHENIEVVVVDDGSTDDLRSAIGDRLADSRVTLIELDRVGDVRARNAGVEATTGDVIVNFDSDNRMHSGYLTRLAAAYAANPDADCAVGAMVWDDGGMHVHVRHDSFEWERLRRQEISLDTNCFSYRRRLRDELGDWDTTLTKHSDWDLALRYTRQHPPLAVDAIAAFYDARRTPDRISYARASSPNTARITARHRPPIDGSLKVLVHCYDYPQLSESYVDTEIAWMTRQGVEVEVFSVTEPGASGNPTVPVNRGDLDAVVERFQPDLIHCHWLSLVAPVVDIARARHIPVTVRSHGFEYSPELVRACIDDGATRSIYLFPHLIGGTDTGHVNLRPVTACFDSERFYPRLQRDRRLVVRAAACLDTKDLESFFHIASACPDYRFVAVLAEIASLPHLPAQFEALNASLGSPVEIRWNVGYQEIAELTARAGVYLHTFGFKLPFGMPVSIAESMACGAIPIVRDCAPGRSYAGECGLYYDSVDDAVGLLDKLAGWSDAEYREHSIASAEFAYARYADEVVLPAILDDWLSLTAISRQ